MVGSIKVVRFVCLVALDWLHWFVRIVAGLGKIIWLVCVAGVFYLGSWIKLACWVCSISLASLVTWVCLISCVCLCSLTCLACYVNLM